MSEYVAWVSGYLLLGVLLAGCALRWSRRVREEQERDDGLAGAIVLLWPLFAFMIPVYFLVEGLAAFAVAVGKRRPRP